MNTLLKTKDLAVIAENYRVIRDIRHDLDHIHTPHITFRELKCIVFLRATRLAVKEHVINNLNDYMTDNNLSDDDEISFYGAYGPAIHLRIGDELLYVGRAPSAMSNSEKLTHAQAVDQLKKDMGIGEYYDCLKEISEGE